MSTKTNRMIMAVGAHADDIELNVGGTLLKYRDRGYEVTYVMSTNNMSGVVLEPSSGGQMNRHYETPVTLMKRRKSECHAAASVLGTIPIHLDHPQRHYNSGNGGESAELRYGCGLPEGVPADVPSILTAHEDAASVERLVSLILQQNAEVIFAHGFIQYNPEHSSTCLLVVKAYWKAVEKGYRGSLLLWYDEPYEELGAFNSSWETWTEVSDYMDGKINLVYLHACQFPASNRLPDQHLRERAKKWGEASGGKAGEVFTFVNAPYADKEQGEIEKELRGNCRPKSQYCLAAGNPDFAVIGFQNSGSPSSRQEKES